MKKREVMTDCPMSAFLAVLAGLWLGLAIGGCGSSGDGAVNLPVNNHLLNGVYHLYVMNQDESDNSPLASYIINGNGDGTASATGFVNITYAIYSDRSVTIDPGMGIEKLYGKVSADGDVFAFTDTVYDVAGTDVELGIGVRNSSGLTMTDLAGEYIIYQVGMHNNAGAYEFYTSRVGIIANLDTTGQYGILNHSNAAAVGLTGTFTATLNPDGTFIVNNGSYDDFGILDPDGEFFVLADTDNADDSEVILSVGIKNSGSAPDLAGEYLINQIGLAFSNSQEYTARVSVSMSASTYNFQVLAHSFGLLGSGGPFEYSVNTDGTIGMVGRVVGIQATGDGSLMGISDTEMGAEEIVFGIALR